MPVVEATAAAGELGTGARGGLRAGWRQRSAGRALRTLAVPGLVWATWLAVVVSDGWFVGQYGLRVPNWDDWNIIPVAVGKQPITLEWLWSFHMDHRIPLPRLVFVGLFGTSGQDVRAIMWLNVALLSVAVLLGMVIARRRAGRTRLTDAVLPLSLASIANYSNLVWAAQIQYILSVALFCLVVCLLLSRADWFSLSRVALVGLGALCLPLTGSTGLALAVPLIGLLPLAAWMHRQRPGRCARAARWLAVLAAVALVALVAGYDLGDRPASPVTTPAANVLQMVQGSVQLAAVGFAAPPLPFIPPLPLPDSLPSVVAAYFSADWVGHTWRLRAAVLLAAAGVALAGLVWPVVRRRRPARLVLGPLACLACVGALDAAIGYARGDGLAPRYITLGATLIFTVYLCLSVLRHRGAALTSWALLLTSLVLLPWSVYQAVSFGQARRAFEAGLTSDIRAGVPVDLLGTRYYPHLWGDPTLAAGAIKEMRDDRIGPFASGDLVLNDAPPTVVAEQALSTVPSAVHSMRRVGDAWEGSGGSDSYVLFATGAVHLAGVRLTYHLSNASASPGLLSVAWSAAQTADFDQPGHTFVQWGAPADGQPQEVVAWIGAPVEVLRVTPDVKPATFSIDEIVLLLAK